MIDFFKKLFGQSSSSATAKERLRLVLMTDHIALAPEMIDQMKRDLVDVISRYVQVDREKVEVNFEREDRALAMLANIPIVSVNRPSSGDSEKVETEKEAPAEPLVEQTAQAEDEPVATASPSVAAAPNVASPGAQAATNAGAPPPRRRRRKKSGGTPKPATAH
jgi:cell division topological specificity factor